MTPVELLMDDVAKAEDLVLRTRTEVAELEDALRERNLFLARASRAAGIADMKLHFLLRRLRGEVA